MIFAVKGKLLPMAKRKKIRMKGSGLNLLTTEEASRFLRKSASMMEDWRKKDYIKRHGFKGPTYVKIGRHIFYRLADLLSFIEKGVVRS